MHFLMTYLLAGAALAVVFLGGFALLPLVGLLAAQYGPGAGALALGGVLLLCGAAMRGLARLVDARTGEPGEGGPRAARDRVFCLRCGAGGPPDGVVCARCGGTRFGLAPPTPGAAGGPADPRPRPGGLATRLRQAVAGWLRGAADRLGGRPGAVYVCVVRGRCYPARLPELRRLADDRLVPALRGRPGLLAWYGGGDPAAGTLLAVSLWSTAAAARGASAPAPAPPGDQPTFAALGARFDPPEVYEAILRA